MGLGFIYVGFTLARYNILTPCTMYYNDELPHEVIVAIQRVLEVKTGEEGDPLDALSTNFSAVDILNELFPDGALA
jgi:hypothetical protein